MEKMLLKLQENDDWFWERQTVKELCALRSVLLGPKVKVCIWSVLCVTVVFYSWVLLGLLREPNETIYKKIFNVFYIMVAASGSIIYFLMPVTKHIRVKTSKDAANGVLSASVFEDLVKCSAKPDLKEKEM